MSVCICVFCLYIRIWMQTHFGLSSLVWKILSDVLACPYISEVWVSFMLVKLDFLMSIKCRIFRRDLFMFSGVSLCFRFLFFSPSLIQFTGFPCLSALLLYRRWAGMVRWRAARLRTARQSLAAFFSFGRCEGHLWEQSTLLPNTETPSDRALPWIQIHDPGKFSGSPGLVSRASLRHWSLVIKAHTCGWGERRCYRAAHCGALESCGKPAEPAPLIPWILMRYRSKS